MADANHRTCVVYGLFSSAGGGIRYVGQTTSGVATRLRKHVEKAVRKSTKPTHREAWIRQVVREGHAIRWVVLQQSARWNIDEIRWIKRLRSKGLKLVNGTRGGEGMLDAPPALKKQIANKVTALWLDPEYRDHMKAVKVGKPWSEARKAAYRMGEAQRRSDNQKIARAKMSPERRSEISSIAGCAGRDKRAAMRAASASTSIQSHIRE